MKVVVLAAGYATRLYPLTLTRPKPLLPVAGKAMIEHVLDHLAPIGGFDQVYVLSNAKFFGAFEQWAAGFRSRSMPYTIEVIDDGSTDDGNKLGAIGDLHFLLKEKGIADDLIVVAGDNLFTESLADFGRVCREKNVPVIGTFDVGRLDQARKYSTIKVDTGGQLIEFEEKPAEPATTIIGIALYYYPKATLPKIFQYVAEGNNPDQPGRLVQWLHTRCPVLTWPVPGLWYDIGSKETLEEANRIFSKLSG